MTHPPFYEGTFSQAVEAARKELKFLLIYLHKENDEDSDRFCQSVLGNPEVIGYISHSMMFWVGYESRAEGLQVRFKKEPNTSLCLIVLKKNGMTVVGRKQGGLPNSRELLDWLDNTVVENGELVRNARVKRE